MMSLSWVVLLTLLGIFCQECTGIKDRNRGAFVAHFTSAIHGIKGDVWAIDEDTVFIENFSYDGKGPDAFFWVGKEGRQPSPNGSIIQFPFDSLDTQSAVMRRFESEDVILRLPKDIKVTEVKWLSVWCRRFAMNLGHAVFPKDLEPPRKLQLPEFKRIAHGVRSGNVTILDAKTFYIPNLHYDGAGPDAYFWVGNGTKPNYLGKKVPNERGKYDVLKGYDGEDIEIQLPDNLTVYDIDYLAIWCVAYKHDFGHVLIPRDNLWVPPALGQTRVKPGDVDYDGEAPATYPSPYDDGDDAGDEGGEDEVSDGSQSGQVSPHTPLGSQGEDLNDGSGASSDKSGATPSSLAAPAFLWTLAVVFLVHAVLGPVRGGGGGGGGGEGEM